MLQSELTSLVVPGLFVTTPELVSPQRQGYWVCRLECPQAVTMKTDMGNSDMVCSQILVMGVGLQEEGGHEKRSSNVPSSTIFGTSCP